MARKIDWAAHKKALAKGRKAVAKAAPSPREIDAVAGCHGAMQLAAWGVDWPPPKGWKAKLAELWQAQQKQTPVKKPAADAPPDPHAVLMRKTKDDLVAELLECQEVMWSQLARITALAREALGAGGAETPEKFTAAQIRRGGMEFERQAAIEWLREQGKPGLAAALERMEHYGIRKSA